MRYFHNDYNEICHPKVLEKIHALSGMQMGGYSIDSCCEAAADQIRTLCEMDDATVHFLVGGTQTNLTVIAAALRPYQGVIAADSGHVSVHETGAIEATGHKVIALPAVDGKLSADQVAQTARSQSICMDAEHMVQPKMVYISQSTELGTVYTRKELEELRRVCDQYHLWLYIDGARLGYALTAEDCDVTLADMARLSDVFYIGGTKVGAMFGEAVVFSDPVLATDFRYMIKQRGGLLAKGWLLGAQFQALLADDLYFKISQHANKMADLIRETLDKKNCPMLVRNKTNQVFPIISHEALEQIGKNFTYAEIEQIDDSHKAVRFCTSWATREKDVLALCEELEKNI